MSVYREGYHAVEQIQKNSKQIWNDAADYGALTKEGDSLWNTIKFACTGYDIKSTRFAYVHSEKTKQVTVTICLMDEWRYSDDNDGHRHGKLNENDYYDFFEITYQKCPGIPKCYDGFFEVQKITNPTKRNQLITQMNSELEKA